MLNLLWNFLSKNIQNKITLQAPSWCVLHRRQPSQQRPSQ
jgi:hypothetical protein